MSARQQPLPEQADVVVIGGGVIGASIAFQLARAGVSRVVLVERNSLGSGSTCRAAGGVRAQFSDELNVAIAQRSLAAFREFGDIPGWEIAFKEVGYLFLLTQEEDCASFEQSVALQNGLGVPSRMLTPAQALELCPVISVEDVLAGAFSPGDGHATPEAVLQGYATAARSLGVHIAVQCEASEVRTRGSRIEEVVTTKGTVATDTVICAAGAWSRACGAMVGVDLPVTPLRRQILFTEPLPDLPSDLPMTIDFDTSFYFHREGPGVLMGMSDKNERPGFDVSTHDDWIPGLMAAAERRAPGIASAGIRGGWAGLYEMTPDHNGLLGEARGVSRFLYATGFSGHGFLQAPAVGEIVRDLYLGRSPFVDVGPLSAERFASDALRPEFNVV